MNVERSLFFKTWIIYSIHKTLCFYFANGAKLSFASVLKMFSIAFALPPSGPSGDLIVLVSVEELSIKDKLLIPALTSRELQIYLMQ